jgi:hypothetical protein
MFPADAVDFTTPAPVEVVEIIPAMESAAAACPQEPALPDVPKEDAPRGGESSA